MLTGDAGNPALAADPGSLAGKVLRIEQPTTVDQAPPTTALSGLGAGGGMCIDPADGSLYVTDRTADGGPAAAHHQGLEGVHGVDAGRTSPGVAGCAALDGTVLVNLVNTKQTVAVRLAPATGAVTGEPEVVRQDTHGHAWALRDVPRRQRLGRNGQQDRRRRREARRRRLPAVPAGRRFPRSNADKT